MTVIALRTAPTLHKRKTTIKSTKPKTKKVICRRVGVLGASYVHVFQPMRWITWVKGAKLIAGGTGCWVLMSCMVESYAHRPLHPNNVGIEYVGLLTTRPTLFAPSVKRCVVLGESQESIAASYEGRGVIDCLGVVGESR